MPLVSRLRVFCTRGPLPHYDNDGRGPLFYDDHWRVKIAFFSEFLIIIGVMFGPDDGLQWSSVPLSGKQRAARSL